MSGEILPFYSLCPAIAEPEMRWISIKNHPRLPDGDYGLLDTYCADPNCDCRVTSLCSAPVFGDFARAGKVFRAAGSPNGAERVIVVLSSTCEFCRIVRGETERYLVFEDEVSMAFLDLRLLLTPSAPMHGGTSFRYTWPLEPANRLGNGGACQVERPIGELNW